MPRHTKRTGTCVYFSMQKKYLCIWPIDLH